jgi:putative tryptophan/tyrosine transport system substrate-binding protein
MPSRRPTIGFLCPCTLDIWRPWIDAFENQLDTHGWTKGKTVDIDYEEAKGLEKNYKKYAKEFVNRKVNVIVTGGTQSTMACKRAAAKVRPPIPVVFGTAGSPLDTKLVSSYNQPGNLTGMANQQTNLVIERLDILRRALDSLPGKHYVGLVGNDKSPNVKLEMKIAEFVAPTLGLKLRKGYIRKQQKIVPVIRRLKGQNVKALLVCTDPLITTYAADLNAEATKAGMITMHAFLEYLNHGGHISYGPKFVELFRSAADMVDRILRGEAVGNIPVGCTVDFQLGIKPPHFPFPVSQSLLALADEVIQ